MNKSYLYTETAYHHQGEKGYIKKLIDASVEAGADGIKFQVLTNPKKSISTKHPAFETLSSYCFSFDDWDEIFGYTAKKGLDIIMMPINKEALGLLNNHNIRYVDIHSISFNDYDLLDLIKVSGVDIILGVGGRTLEEIVQAKTSFGDQLKVLMVGFQSFPTKLEDVKMSKISIFKSLFPDMEIGYADHSNFSSQHAISSNEYARILGAVIFEKHIAIEEGVERIDYQAAVSKQKITEIIERLEFLEENVLLSAEHALQMHTQEIVYRNRQLRCVASREISAGEKIAKEDVSLKMVENQTEAYAKIEHVAGKTAIINFEYDQTFFVGDLED